MGNRNVQGRTLLPHQRKIWTEAFKASLYHTSIESAERKAWQAVDICERVGAFGEVSCPVQLPDHVIDWDAAWTALCNWLNFAVGDPGLDDSDIQKLWQTLLDFQRGGMSTETFRLRLQAIYATE